MTRNGKCLMWYILLGPVLLAVAVFGNELLGHLEVQHELQLCRDAGMELDPEKLTPPPVPEDQNGAALFLKAFKERAAVHSNVPMATHDLLDVLTVDGCVMERDVLAELAKYFREYEKTLQLAREALARPHCRYDPLIPGELDLQPLSGPMGLASLAANRAMYLHRTAGSEEAYRCVRDGLRLRKALRTDGGLVALLVDIAIVEQGIGQMAIFLEAGTPPSPEMARRLIEALPRRHQLLARIRQAAESELAMFLLPLWSSVHPEWFRITRLFDAEHLAFAVRMNRRMAGSAGRPWLQLNAEDWPQGRWYHVYYESNASLIGWPKTGWTQAPHGFMATRVLQQAAGGIAKAEMARLALLLELHRHEHGMYPKGLAELSFESGESLPSDPFDGKPYRYRKLTDGYKLWSVGKNCVDDGGLSWDQYSHLISPDEEADEPDDIVFWTGPEGRAARQEVYDSEEEKQDALDERRQEVQDALDEFRTEWKQYEADKAAGLFDEDDDEEEE